MSVIEAAEYGVLLSRGVCVITGAHLAAVRGNDAKVSRDPVSTFYLHQISCHNLLGIDLHLLSLADHQGLLGTREGERKQRKQNRRTVSGVL